MTDPDDGPPDLGFLPESMKAHYARLLRARARTVKVAGGRPGDLVGGGAVPGALAAVRLSPAPRTVL